MTNSFTPATSPPMQVTNYSLPTNAVGATQVVRIPVGIQGLPTSPPTGVAVSVASSNGILGPVDNLTKVAFTLN